MSRRSQFMRKLILYRNGDPSFKPIHYLYNNQKIRNFDKLLEEFDLKVPPLRGGAVRNLYTVDGDFKIENVEQLEGETSDLTIVVASAEPYRPLKGGYEKIGQPKRSKKATPPERPAKEKDSLRPTDQRIQNRPDPRSETKKVALVRCDDAGFGPKPHTIRMRYVRTFDAFLADLERIAPPLDKGQPRLFSIRGDEVKSLEEIESGATYAIGGEKGFIEPRGGFPGHGSVGGGIRRARSSDSVAGPRSPAATPRGSPRPEGERVYNRIDQIHPDKILVFLFLNGEGLKAKRLIFTAAQLQRGWPWFMEQLGKEYGVYPKKLRCMDGREVNHVAQLVPKGAYVLVPMGQNFRDDKWYYLPDKAVDTSGGGEDNDYQGGERPKTRARRGGDGSEDERTESAQNSPDNHRFDYDDDYYSDGGGSHRGSPRGASRQSRRSAASRQSQRSNVSRRASRSSRYGSDASDDEGEERRDSSTLDEDEEDWAHSARGHRHHHDHHHDHGSRRGSRVDSACSYCDMLEAHLSKHHGSRQHTPAHRRHSAGSRRKRVQDNVRSISPSPTRSKQKHSHGAGTGRKSIVSRKAGRGKAERLTVSHGGDASRQGGRKEASPRRQSRSEGLRRTNSEGGLFYARQNSSRGSNASPYNIKRDRDSPFQAKGKRREAQGAREVRESGSRRTNDYSNRRQFNY